MSTETPKWLTTDSFRSLNAGVFSNRRWRLAAGLVVALLISVTLLSSDRRSTIKSAWEKNKVGKYFNGGVSDSTFNETLGFQKIFAIGMKERTDKWDAMELAASISGMDITWSEGVATKDVSLKSVPENWKTYQEYGVLGSWRAHLNVLDKIVKERIQSTLIFEDDADWDITVKGQMSIYAQGVRTLQGSGDAVHHPYGTDWDLHWVGNCRSGPSFTNKPVFVVHNDSTVPPIPHRSAYWKHTTVPDYVLSNNSRVVHDCGSGGMCTYAYAVSFNGAQKILSALFAAPEFIAFDKSISGLCAVNYPRPFQCYAVYPPLLSSYRFAGPQGRNTDNMNMTNGVIVPESAQDLVYSTRINSKRLIDGELFATSQWNDTQFEHRPLDESYVNQVTTEVVQMNWQNERVEWVKGVNSRHDS